MKSEYSTIQTAPKIIKKNAASYLFKFLLLANICMYLEAGAVPAMLLQIADSFGMTSGQQGLLGGIVYFSLGFAGTFSGFLLRHYDHRTVLASAISINNIFTLIWALTPVQYSFSSTLFIIVRFFMGLTQCVVCVFLPLWTNEYAPVEQKTSWMSYLQASVPVGVMMGYVISSLTLSLSQNSNEETIGENICYGLLCWRWPIIIEVILVLPFCFAIYFVPREHISVRIQGKPGTPTSKNRTNTCISKLKAKQNSIYHELGVFTPTTAPDSFQEFHNLNYFQMSGGRAVTSKSLNQNPPHLSYEYDRVLDTSTSTSGSSKQHQRFLFNQNQSPLHIQYSCFDSSSHNNNNINNNNNNSSSNSSYTPQLQPESKYRHMSFDSSHVKILSNQHLSFLPYDQSSSRPVSIEKPLSTHGDTAVFTRGGAFEAMDTEDDGYGIGISYVSFNAFNTRSIDQTDKTSADSQRLESSGCNGQSDKGRLQTDRKTSHHLHPYYSDTTGVMFRKQEPIRRRPSPANSSDWKRQTYPSVRTNPTVAAAELRRLRHNCVRASLFNVFAARDMIRKSTENLQTLGFTIDPETDPENQEDLTDALESDLIPKLKAARWSGNNLIDTLTSDGRKRMGSRLADKVRGGVRLGGVGISKDPLDPQQFSLPDVGLVEEGSSGLGDVHPLTAEVRAGLRAPSIRRSWDPSDIQNHQSTVSSANVAPVSISKSGSLDSTCKPTYSDMRNSPTTIRETDQNTNNSKKKSTLVSRLHRTGSLDKGRYMDSQRTSLLNSSAPSPTYESLRDLANTEIQKNGGFDQQSRRKSRKRRNSQLLVDTSNGSTVSNEGNTSDKKENRVPTNTPQRPAGDRERLYGIGLDLLSETAGNFSSTSEDGSMNDNSGHGHAEEGVPCRFVKSNSTSPTEKSIDGGVVNTDGQGAGKGTGRCFSDTKDIALVDTSLSSENQDYQTSQANSEVETEGRGVDDVAVTNTLTTTAPSTLARKHIRTHSASLNDLQRDVSSEPDIVITINMDVVTSTPLQILTSDSETDSSIERQCHRGNAGFFSKFTLNFSQSSPTISQRSLIQRIRHSTLSPFIELLCNPVYVYLVLAMAALYFVVTGVQFWGTSYMTLVLQAPLPLVNATFILCAASGPTLGVFFGGWLVDYFGGYTGLKQRVIALSLCFCSGTLACILATALSFVRSLLLFVPMLWLVLFFGGSILPACSGMVVSVIPRRHRTISASLSMVIFNIFGYCLSLVLSGYVMQIVGAFVSSCDEVCARICGFRVVLLWSYWSLLFLGLALYTSYRESKRRKQKKLMASMGDGPNTWTNDTITSTDG